LPLLLGSGLEMNLLTMLELEVGEIFLEADPLSLFPLEENLGGVSESVGVESCLRYLLILLELGPLVMDDLLSRDDAAADVTEADKVEEYLLYEDVEDDPLTLDELTHSAW